MKNIKNYFASGITGSGFVNFFEFINNKNKPGMLYILKGGPGTGKSTLLKKIGKHFSEKGEAVECFYCSSDPLSLDGVRISKRNIAIVDGTAPHVYEPQMPAVNETVINLLPFISNGVNKQKNQLNKLINKKAFYYKLLYPAVSAAALLYESNLKIFEAQSSEDEIEKETKKVLNSLNLCNNKERGFSRKFFLNTIANGMGYGFTDVNSYKNTLTISGNNYFCYAVLSALNLALNKAGYNTICFCNTLLPNNIESVYIQQLKTFISAKPNSNNLKKETAKIINFNNKQINVLKTQAAQLLSLTRRAHNSIEKIYYKHVNFCAINQLTAQLITQIDK